VGPWDDIYADVRGTKKGHLAQSSAVLVTLSPFNMLRNALLYLVLCIIAIRPILCDDIDIPPELISELEEKVQPEGRQLFIKNWCQRPRLPTIKCVRDEIKKVELHEPEPVSTGQLTWAMMGVPKTKRVGLMEGCHKSCFAKLGIDTKDRLTESDTKNYELCRSDCILDKVYTSKKQSKKVHTPEEQPQRVRKRSRRGRQYGR
jgi:hypothetical protein